MDENMDLDTSIMKRVISLAKTGEDSAHNSPLVGAAVANGGRIAGIGYNKGSFYEAGWNALRSAAGNTQNGSLYLNLEPDFCDIKAKALGDKIIKSGIRRIVMAMENPGADSKGRWTAFIREMGIEVKCGIAKDEAEQANEIYIKYSKTGTPFVILKTAVGFSDGIIKSIGENQWMTEAAVRDSLKRVRKRVMGVMTGIGTILVHDPILYAPVSDKKDAAPISIVLDSHLRLPACSAVFKAACKSKLIIACTEKGAAKRREFFESEGAIVIVTPEKNGMIDIPYLMKELGTMKIDSLLVEGGCRLSRSIINEHIADKILGFTAPKVLQGEGRKTSINYRNIHDSDAVLELRNIKCLKVGRSLLVEGYKKEYVTS